MSLENETKNMTPVDDKTEIMQRIGKNIRYIRERDGVSQTELLKRIKEKRGYNYQQTYISRIENGKYQGIPGLLIALICEALNVDVQTVFWENLDTSEIIKTDAEDCESGLVYVSKKNEFKHYLGTYHCYFYPTKSNETKKRELYGTLKLTLSEHTNECIAIFCLCRNYDVKNIYKEYKGRLILSDTYGCCYCYLTNEKFGEVSFLMFEGLSSNGEKLTCRMAEVLTPSAGGTRDVTCHRMFISRQKLSQQGIEFVKPHIKMNSSEIDISETNLNEVFDELNVPDDFRETIKKLTKPEIMYALREEHFHGFGEKNMQNYDKTEFITALRKKSHANHYYKIGKKVNRILHSYLYETENGEMYFEKVVKAEETDALEEER